MGKSPKWERRSKTALSTLITATVLTLAISQVALAQSSARRLPSVAPRGGFVPDTITAVRIAEAVWVPIFGEKAVEEGRPFVVRLRAGIWEVRAARRGVLGGSLEIDIAKKDGRVLRVWRGK